jgi:hypothetical protein
VAVALVAGLALVFGFASFAGDAVAIARSRRSTASVWLAAVHADMAGFFVSSAVVLAIIFARRGPFS